MSIIDRPIRGGGSSGSGDGEANTGVSLGTGAEIYKTKVGTQLQFRSLIAGGSININQGTNEVRVSAPPADFSRLSALSQFVNDTGYITTAASATTLVVAQSASFNGPVAFSEETNFNGMVNINGQDLNADHINANSLAVSGSTSFAGTVSFNGAVVSGLGVSQLLNDASYATEAFVETSFITENSANSRYQTLNRVVGVSGEVTVSGGDRNTIYFLEAGGRLTIANDNWQPGYRIEVIATVSGVGVSAGGGVTINRAASANGVSFDTPGAGASIIARTSTQFWAVGRLA